MEIKDLPIILNNLNYINVSMDTLISSFFRSNKIPTRDKVINTYKNIFKNLDVDYSNISKVTIRKDGIYYNIDSLLSQIKHVYGFSNLEKDEIETAMKKMKEANTLSELSDRFPHLNCSKFLENNVSKLIKQNNSNLDKRDKQKKACNPSKKGYKQRLKRIDKMFPICEDVRETAKKITFKTLKKSHLYNLDLLLKYCDNNFKSFTKVPHKYIELIDTGALNLLVALSVKGYAENTNKDSKNYAGLIKYLKDYLENNEYLLLKDYTISIEYNNPLGLSGVKRYKIRTIQDFINEIENNDNKEQVSIKEDNNHSFFGYDSKEKSREVLKQFYRICDAKINESTKRVMREKLDYYNELDYLKIHIGQNSFDGYLGFELDNGIVVIDKIYNNSQKEKLSTDSAAVYITTVDEFAKIRDLSRMECIHKISNKEIIAKRIYHNVGWQEKVTKTSKVIVKK